MAQPFENDDILLEESEIIKEPEQKPKDLEQIKQKPKDPEQRKKPVQTEQKLKTLVQTTKQKEKPHNVVVGLNVLGTWSSTILLIFILVYAIKLNKKFEHIEDQLSSINTISLINTANVKKITEADVLNINAVMMQNSSTWTFPVSSIQWSGR